MAFQTAGSLMVKTQGPSKKKVLLELVREFSGITGHKVSNTK